MKHEEPPMKNIILIIALALAIAAGSAITLDESIALARQNNKTLLMAREDMAKSGEAANEIRAKFLPQLNLAGAYSLNKTYLPDSALSDPVDLTLGINPMTASDNDYYLAGAISGIVNSLLPTSPLEEGSLALSLQMNQVLFSGGRLLNGLKATQRYQELQELNYQVTGQDVVLNTTKMFYSCLLASKLVDVQAEALETARRHLAQVESFSAEGMVAEYDLLQARLEIAKLEPQLSQARNNLELALAAFRNQLGSDDPNLVPEGQFLLPPKLELTLEEALSQGLEKRAELVMAGLGAQIAEINLKIEKGGYLPSLGLQASAALYTAADEFAIESTDYGTNYSVGIGISIPLFDGLGTRARVCSARHGLLRAKLQQQDLESLIRLEITQDFQNLRHAEENYGVQSQNIQMAERGLQLAQIRYENQVGIQLEVFDAQTTLAAIRLQYYQSIFEVITATLELQKAMGITL
jgi:outer membrane protein TolC